MSEVQSMSRRRFGFIVAGGAAIALAIVGMSHANAAGSVRTIKIATAAESKPLAWGAIGVQPQGYEPDLLRAINAKLPQYKFEMEGVSDIAREITRAWSGRYGRLTGYRPVPECGLLIVAVTRAAARATPSEI